jgi:hypothetical protein
MHVRAEKALGVRCPYHRTGLHTESSTAYFIDKVFPDFVNSSSIASTAWRVHATGLGAT